MFHGTCQYFKFHFIWNSGLASSSLRAMSSRKSSGVYFITTTIINLSLFDNLHKDTEISIIKLPTLVGCQNNTLVETGDL
jgi:hypothetical protein